MFKYPLHGPMPADGPKVIPASTVVIFRNAASCGPPELLMVQRAREMRFAGGAAVFPGGRIDTADRTLAARLLPGDDPEVAAARIAGIRETLEETGLMIAVNEPLTPDDVKSARDFLIKDGTLAPVLDRFGWTLDPYRLQTFAHWCPMQDGAFDTRFFITDLGTGAVDVAVDATENTRLFWTSAADALQRAEDGDITIIFPTRRNLERLAQFSGFAEAAMHARDVPTARLSPVTEVIDGDPWLMVPEGYGYPVRGQTLASARRG